MGEWRGLTSGPLGELFTVELSPFSREHLCFHSKTDRTIVFLAAHTVSSIIRDHHCSSVVSQLISLCVTLVSFTADLVPDVPHSVGMRA